MCVRVCMAPHDIVRVCQCASYIPILELGLRGGLLGSPKLLLKGPSDGGS